MKIKRNETIALLVDVQERLLPVMAHKEQLMSRLERLLKGLKLLEVPILISQQYTKGLGMTEGALLDILESREYMEKISFSCWGEETIREAIQSCPEKRTVLVFGIESHICVLQTVLDLLENGYQAVVIVDCLDSRREQDMEIALRRMEQAGAILTTSEACLFELTEKAGSKIFKQISRLVK